ncbi:MAG: ATP synthase subunit C [Sedimenticolaceae bacterium]|nr:ATP synthase subunit C [Sedimenticolaceae bacterium]
MYLLLAMVTTGFLGMIVFGLYYELRPADRLPSRGVLKPLVGGNLVLFAIGVVGLLFFAVNEVMAATEEAAGLAEMKDVSLGYGLALIGIGLPTGLAAIGAAFAIGPVGAAALAVIGEKPEVFGRTLIYLGLAEGVAIYGLVMSILLLGKL